MRVSVMTLAELAGCVCVVAGGFLLGIGWGVVALGAVLLYEAKP